MENVIIIASRAQNILKLGILLGKREELMLL